MGWDDWKDLIEEIHFSINDLKMNILMNIVT